MAEQHFHNFAFFSILLLFENKIYLCYQHDYLHLHLHFGYLPLLGIGHQQGSFSLFCLGLVYPVVPRFNASFSCQPKRSRLQVFLGLPFYLFPWESNRRACLVVLVGDLCNSWPIHFKRWFEISLSGGFSCVRCQSSPLLMVAGQRILRILLKQLLRKVSNFFLVFKK